MQLEKITGNNANVTPKAQERTDNNDNPDHGNKTPNDSTTNQPKTERINPSQQSIKRPRLNETEKT
jgi:hypothetical protein